MGKRGDSFASWFVALPKGRKFVMSLVLASVTILTPALLLTPAHHWDRISPNQFEFTCADQDGDRQVSVELPTDPDRINEMNQNPEEFVALFRKACPTY
ncbi:MAG: hypothetical protein HZB45_04430 [Mycolicibacterium rufum]|uniref:Uncharacterized protein n=1 Tax=Mycolicibacterium chlorophenolicum TaxID=37916 RepID=A0A0J6W434_9MYCO|nr:hypothetical protein [Mycolicibacterium chlorophenolicum]KMO78060.1 hypothetical protein MCHLDSM_01971 [Mycolicibacterium chlorophenolicum]MBI5336914.1 hypothetical protein [Mycolicibacterium rufum]